MEAYKTTCSNPRCGHVSYWRGPKTGFGLSKEQMERWEIVKSFCFECEGHAETTLDFESQMGQQMTASTNLVVEFLKEHLSEGIDLTKFFFAPTSKIFKIVAVSVALFKGGKVRGPLTVCIPDGAGIEYIHIKDLSLVERVNEDQRSIMFLGGVDSSRHTGNIAIYSVKENVVMIISRTSLR